MLYFLGFLACAALSWLFVGIAKKIGEKYGLFHSPRKRDVHKTPKVRIGGVGIFAAFLIVSGVIFWVLNGSEYSFSGIYFGFSEKLIAIWTGGFIITVSMLFDDIWGLKTWQKFFFQILVVAIIISSGIGLDTLPNPFGDPINLNSVYLPIWTSGGVTHHFSLWSDLLTLFWVVGMINVINFIDGVDGLAAGISTIAAGTIFILSASLAVAQPNMALLSIILAGASFGFLIWNFPPAKLFMGDSGAMFLGFMLGVLPLMSGGKLATAFLVLGIPIVDGLYVAGSRLLHGKSPFSNPDNTHLHHRFLKAGFTVRQSILILYVIAIAFAWVALRTTTLAKIVAAVILVALILVLILYLNRRGESRRVG